MLIEVEEEEGEIQGRIEVSKGKEKRRDDMM